jgi:hypothetical protein
MDKLFFEFKRLDHPYPEDSLASRELWGEIKLIHLSKEGIRTLLFDHQWNLIEVFKWFNENRNILLKDNYPFEELKDKCIAESRDQLYKKDNFISVEDQDHYYSTLEDYFSHHYFKLRGTPTPLFYIGLNKGIGEISRYDSNSYLSLKFDMNDFISSTEAQIRNITSR